MASIAEILAQRKAANAGPKPSIELYVDLFNVDPHYLYIDYMENLRWIIYWLGLPEKVSATGKVPLLLATYPIREMAKLLDVPEYTVWVVAMTKAKMPEKIS